jgi:hypothetical protein
MLQVQPRAQKPFRQFSTPIPQIIRIDKTAIVAKEIRTASNPRKEARMQIFSVRKTNPNASISHSYDQHWSQFNPCEIQCSKTKLQK